MSQLADTSLIKQYQQQYESLLEGAEPQWLKQRRLLAFDSFIAKGLPNTRVEEWKYTPLRLWEKHNFHYTPNNIKVSQLQELQLFSMLDEQSYDIVMVDGMYYAEHSAHEHLPSDVIITDFADAIQNHSEMMRKYLGQAVFLEKHPFASLCESIAQKGMVLIIPDNIVFDSPIHILFATSKNSQNCVNHLRNLIVVGKNSKVEIIEHYANLNDVVYFNNVVTEIIVEENAKTSHFKLEQEGNQSFHIGGVHVKQMQGSTFNSYAVTLSGHFSRHDIRSRLIEPMAYCELNGLYFTHNTQHVDYHTAILHEAAHCTSSSLYKGILNDRSVAVFNGKVAVQKDAQKTNSSLANHNLLLSDSCEINSKPELEIYNDDVKCAHGATTGHLNQEALFFLQARGIAPHKARRMLIRAFANEIFNQMPSNTVKNYCQRYLEMAAYE